MELSEEQKKIVIEILSNADGEDMDEIVKLVGFTDYLSHSLIMSMGQYELDYYLQERKHIRENHLNQK